MNDVRQTFAKNLRFLMNLNGINANQLSKASGVTQQTLSRYLNCQRTITLDNLIKIADIFCEDLDYFVGR